MLTKDEVGIVILGKHFIQRLLNISCLRSANFRTLSVLNIAKINRVLLHC